VRVCDEGSAHELAAMKCDALVATAASDSATRDLLCDLGFVRYCGGGFDAGVCFINGYLMVEYNSMIVLGVPVTASDGVRTYVENAESNHFRFSEIPCTAYMIEACWPEGCGSASADFTTSASTSLLVWVLLPNVGRP
jgi:hypothetical protein